MSDCTSIGKDVTLALGQDTYSCICNFFYNYRLCGSNKIRTSLEL